MPLDTDGLEWERVASSFDTQSQSGNLQNQRMDKHIDITEGKVIVGMPVKSHVD